MRMQALKDVRARKNITGKTAAKTSLVVDFPQPQTTIHRRSELNVLGARQIANQKTTPYATGADFCRIFSNDMTGLYLLSFLLTADPSRAERCFVEGLGNCQNGNSVFKEWAQSWARRTIITNAIRMVRPRPVRNPAVAASYQGAPQAMTVPAEFAAIVELQPIERFAFVMSMLEHYSDQECSLLLDCTRADVIAARMRALQRIGSAPKLHRMPVAIGAGASAA